MPLDLGKARSFQRFDQLSAAKVYGNRIYALNINVLS